MRLKQFEEKLSEDKHYRESINKNDLFFEISEMVVEARMRRGLTQEKLARKMGTKQSSIARLENGTILPSIKFLDKMASALGTELIVPKFKFLEVRETTTVNFEQTIEHSETVVMQGITAISSFSSAANRDARPMFNLHNMNARELIF
jgi:transcriptional regulator with XRE-family HTH domain